MIFVAILSIVLIWLHISSLRVIIKSKTGDAAIKEAEEMEAAIGEETKDLSPVSGPGLISLIIIIVLNLIEIGYFVACVYLFGGLIITIGSSILIGYTIYSLIKFLPNIKKFFNLINFSARGRHNIGQNLFSKRP